MADQPPPYPHNPHYRQPFYPQQYPTASMYGPGAHHPPQQAVPHFHPQPAPSQPPSQPRTTRRQRQPLLIVDPETKTAIELPDKPEDSSQASTPVAVDAAASPAVQGQAVKPPQTTSAAVPIQEPTAKSKSQRLTITTPNSSQPASAEPSPVKTRGPGLPEVDEMAQMVASVKLESAAAATEATGEDDDDVFDAEPASSAVASAVPESPVAGPKVPYDDGCWSPNTPDARKAYSLAFLRQFRTLCRLRLDTDKLTSQQSKLHLELFGPGEPTGVPRQPSGAGNRGNRSKRGSKSTGAGVAGLNFVPSGPGRAKAKQVINLPARATKLERGENAFVPNVAKSKSAAPKTEEDKVQATLLKAQSILNKMTLEKFEKLSDELIGLGEQLSDEALRQFVERVFQKAIDEPFFSKMYAHLCTKCATVTRKKTKEVVLPQFRKNLLEACQNKFEQDSMDAAKTKAFEERRLREAEEQKAAKAAGSEAATGHLSKQELDDEELRVAKARRRTLGNIKFIGELFLCNMVSAGIIVSKCIEPLLQSKAEDEASLECLCKLMETVGAKLDQMATSPEKKSSVDGYIKRMEVLAKSKGLPSRIKFMILDVLDMRSRGWESRTKDAGPKKLSEIHREAEQQQQEIKRKDALARAQQSSGGRGGRNDRNSRQPPVASNPRETVKVERMKLMRPSKGPGRALKLGKGQAADKDDRKISNSFAGLMSDDPPESPVDAPSSAPATPTTKFTPEVMLRKVKATLAEYLDVLDKNEAIECIKELEADEGVRIFVGQLGEGLAFAKPAQRDHLIALLEETIAKGLVDGKKLCTGLVKPLEGLDEMAMDAPHAYDAFARIVAVGVARDLIMAPYLAAPHVTNLAGMNAFRFVLRVLRDLTELAGEAKARELFEKLNSLKPLKDLLPPRSIDADYTEGFDRYNVTYLLSEPTAAKNVFEELATMLKAGTSNQDISKAIDALAKEEEQLSADFLVNYVKTIVLHCLPTNAKGEPEAFKGDAQQEAFSTALDARKELISVPERSQMYVSYGIQAVAASLEFPPKFLHDIAFMCYEKDLLTESALEEWQEDETYSSDKKGVAKSELEPLFLQLASAEEEA
eukprot:m.193731 g.193731  ORF g.193731 m.193731 type:complete len:1096 (-) comp16986_c0_seq1:562-3849(-)